MFGNGIKQTTATTGTGSLTLSSVAGMPTLADVFALNVPISYTLLDSSDLLIEVGIGYLSSSTVLVRNRVIATYVGSTYDSATATAANLSGTTTVICTPQAASIESMLPSVDSQSASVSRFLMSAHRNLNATTLAVAALRLHHAPFLLRTAARVVSLSVNVSAAGVAGTVARAGIYVCNEKGYPGALLATSADFDCASTGLKTSTLTNPISLPPGWYFMSFVASAATTVNAYTSTLANVLGGGPFGFVSSTSPVDYRHETLASAVLPATANTTTTAVAVAGAHAPLVYVGVQ